jgi:hypothetical protein
VNVYERWGVVSGLLYGTLGWLWAFRSKAAAAAAVGLAFAAEPLIAFLVTRAGIWNSLLLDYAWMWTAEVALGLLGVALALSVSPPRGSESML